MALAGSSSAESTMPSRLRVSTIYRESIANTARTEGDENSLCISANSMCISINTRFLNHSFSGSDFEIDLHDLWYTYFQAAMHISSSHPGQDRLAFQVVQAVEQGVLEKYNPDNDSTEIASTSNGMIWTDLPFLASDMTDFWVHNCASMGVAQRTNFSSFLAKLASVGLVNDKLCGIALIVMRETLETPRWLGILDDNIGTDSEQAGRTIDALSVAALLPAANVWLFFAGWKMIQLSDDTWSACPLEVGRVGVLIQEQPSHLVPEAGFSPERWMYWLRRLEQIADEASSAGDNDLAGYAGKMMDNMLLTVEERHSRVRVALAAGGRVVRHQPEIRVFG